MKTLKKLSLLPLIVLLLVGCDALGDLLTITIKNVKMTRDVEITVSTPAMVAQGVPAAGVAFSKSAKVQVSQTEELEEYLDNIKDVTLNSIICNVNGVNQGVVQSLKVTINPLNIYKEITNVTVGEDVNLNFTDDEFKSIANSLLSAKELEFVLTGIVSSTPVTFTVTVTVDANFKVKVLKDKEQ
jgi:uncharacterized protein YcfL